jgi:SAM-dependent methyltransferase
MNDTPDLAAVTQIQQGVWSEGDFAMVANLVVKQSDDLVDALRILPDERVLDVACGSGNAAISAARRSWTKTVGADFVPELLERGRERAAADRLEVEFVEADAQDLPFEDASFDVTISVFGAMFAPDQPKTAAELLRVTKPGGRIGMANWTPSGGVGRMFMTIAKHAPPPPGVNPPLLWGTEDHLRELFGDGISDLQVETKVARQAFRSADHYLEFFRTYFGPIKMAFERVGAEGEAALEQDLREVMEQESSGGERALVLEPEYLQVVATRA